MQTIKAFIFLLIGPLMAISFLLEYFDNHKTSYAWNIFIIGIADLLFGYRSVIGIANVIIGICLIFAPKRKRSYPVDPSILWEKEEEIMHSCWNDKTCEFNWDLWFDRRDEIIWCNYQPVLEGIDSDFRHYGYLQILKIYYIINNNDCNRATNLLCQIEPTIIRNLAEMYSFKNSQIDLTVCPDDIKQFRKQVYQFMRTKGENKNKLREQLLCFSLKLTG